MALRIGIVGAGVIGLTTAIKLHDAGFEPEILTRELSSETTSAVAAAFWYPYKVGHNPNIAQWAEATYWEFRREIEGAVPGVSMAKLREYFQQEPPEPWWRNVVTEFRILDSTELPARFSAAYEYVVPFTDTPVYLPWLVAQTKHRGIPITLQEIETIAELSDRYDLIVNCSGVWARKLAGDERVFPISGQLQLVTPIETTGPGIVIFAEPEQISYLVHRSTDCVLGGTATEGNWDRTPAHDISAAIRARCELLEPRVKDAKTLSNVVGLRPGRDEVRVELTSEKGLSVIHNYGHGGAGYTLCWGCAGAVVALVQKTLLG